MSYTNIKSQLSVASYTLLGSASTLVSAHIDSSEHREPWLMNVGVANYIEQDRNTGLELIINGSRAVEEDRIDLKFELDVITGATPNGATASNVPQSFTMSSGVGSYDVKANELPADDTHMDTRLGVSALYSDRINSNFSLDYHSFISMEFDYLSFGAGVDAKYDLNQHDTSLLFGINFEYNRVHPVGNIPIAFGVMQPPGQPQPRGEAGTSKRVNGFMLGINQIINPQSLFQIKYSDAEASGYLTDPYKILSLIEAPTGNTQSYLFENRPTHRQIQSIYTAYKLFLTGDVLDLSYRYYWDEWDLRSNTINLRYRKRLADQHFVQPRVRYYTQTAANFFTHSLADNEPLPDFASADFRLAEFDAYTLGFKYGKVSGENEEHSITIEYYTQQGNSHPADAIGLQKQQDLFPTLHTLVLFYNYDFKW